MFSYKGVRSVKNGQFYIVPRKQMTDAINFLNSRGTLVRIKELMWADVGNGSILQTKSNIHKDLPALIIGKGPSLDNLTGPMIPKDCVIFACNEAINKIKSMNLTNQVYGCQIDMQVKDIMKDTQAIISPKCLTFYEDKSKIICSRTTPKIVGELAIMSAKLMGCNPIILVAFDGAFGGSCNYAKAVGHSARRGGHLGRFVSHKDYLLPHLNDIKWEHISIPSKYQTELISDSISRLQYNPPEQCEEQDSQPLDEYTELITSVWEKETDDQ